MRTPRPTRWLQRLQKRAAGFVALSVIVGLVPIQVSLSPLDGHALALRYLGYVDLALAYESFSRSDHTLTARFFPQYARGYRGQILSVAGSSRVWLATGEYAVDADPPADTLVLRVDDVTRAFVIPNGVWQRRWYHAAVRRFASCAIGFGCLTTYDVFLDGDRLCTADAICSLSFRSPPDLPSGNLRIGRRVTVPNPNDQFYGFVDDVAVFSRALTPAEIRSLAASRALNGTEPDLVAGFTFDSAPFCFSLAPPSTLRSCYTLGGDAYRQAVSSDRSWLDALRLPLPAEHWSHGAELPFKFGQVWRVTQGYGQSDSHFGTAVFALDFELRGTPTAGKPMHRWNVATDGCGEPLYAVADGTVIDVHDEPGWVDPAKQPPPDPNVDYDGRNHIRLRLEPDVVARYLHLFSGSVAEAFPGVVLPDDDTATGDPFDIKRGRFVGRVGTRNGCHLHLAVNTWDGPPQTAVGTNTIPFGFRKYDECLSSCEIASNWERVSFGVPKHNWHVRRRL